MDEIYAVQPFYYSRRIMGDLRKCQRIMVAGATVQRHMRGLGSADSCLGSNLSRRNAQLKIYPYLLAPRHDRLRPSRQGV